MASFWFDKWIPQGPLINLLGENDTRALGIGISATVSAAIHNNSWRFRHRARHQNEILELIQRMPVPHPDKGDDTFCWRHGPDNFKTFFSASKTWEQIRARKNTENWTKLIWFSQSIPRSSFITWLAFKDRLSTGARMRLWGQNQACILCGERNETRDHLLFACPYTFTIWSDVAGPLLGSAITPD